MFVIVVHPTQQCCSFPENPLSNGLSMKVQCKSKFSTHECVKVLCVTDSA